jgi:hypothetical protein
MTTRELLQRTLEAMDYAQKTMLNEVGIGFIDVLVIEEVRAYLAKPEPDPVAWEDNLGNLTRYKSKYAMRPLFTKDQI